MKVKATFFKDYTLPISTVIKLLEAFECIIRSNEEDINGATTIVFDIHETFVTYGDWTFKMMFGLGSYSCEIIEGDNYSDYGHIPIGSRPIISGFEVPEGGDYARTPLEFINSYLYKNIKVPHHLDLSIKSIQLIDMFYDTPQYIFLYDMLMEDPKASPTLNLLRLWVDRGCPKEDIILVNDTNHYFIDGVLLSSVYLNVDRFEILTGYKFSDVVVDNTLNNDDDSIRDVLDGLLYNQYHGAKFVDVVNEIVGNVDSFVRNNKLLVEVAERRLAEREDQYDYVFQIKLDFARFDSQLTASYSDISFIRRSVSIGSHISKDVNPFVIVEIIKRLAVILENPKVKTSK